MYIPTWAIVAGVIATLFYVVRKKKKDPFSPFYVQIVPIWYHLLRDHALINDTSWEQLKFPDAGYNVLRDGVTFTVLKSDEDSELIYNNNHHTFQSEIDIRERIKEIKLPFPASIDGMYSPQFSVTCGIEGYQLSITTPESQKK